MQAGFLEVLDDAQRCSGREDRLNVLFWARDQLVWSGPQPLMIYIGGIDIQTVLMPTLCLQDSVGLALFRDPAVRRQDKKDKSEMEEEVFGP